MKQYLVILLALLLTAGISCKKTKGITTKVLIHNATYDLTDLTGTWNGENMTTSALSQGQTSGTPGAPYQNLSAGTNNIVLSSGTNILFNKNAYAAATSGYSLLVYDTGKTARSFNTLMLTDDLTIPDTAFAKCRIINCVVDTTSTSFVLLNKRDTAFFATSFSVGSGTPDAASFQSFSIVRYGTYAPYVVQTATGLVLYKLDSVALLHQNIYSLIYSGRRTGTGADSAKLRIILHPSN